MSKSLLTKGKLFGVLSMLFGQHLDYRFSFNIPTLCMSEIARILHGNNITSTEIV